MPIRNFQQLGQAWGSTPTSIEVSLDGSVIYSGPITTTDAPMPAQPGTPITNVLCSWQLDSSFQGTKSLIITSQGSPMYLADTMADRTIPSDTSDFETLAFQQTIDNTSFTDCLTNVVINGVPRTRGSSLDGQWYWLLEPGSTLQATMNIPQGITAQDWDPAATYSAPSQVIYNHAVYFNSDTPPVGVAPSSSPQYWIPIPVQSWSADVAYPIYTRVMSGSVRYMAMQNVPAGTPVTDPAYWQAFSG